MLDAPPHPPVSAASAPRIAAWAASILVAAALAVAALRGAALRSVPIDGAYYLAKALSMGRFEGLRVPWGTGVDTKFFPGISILFAAPVRALGMPLGWVLVEVLALATCCWLIFRLGKRLGFGTVACCAAAAAFAVDPLVLKWASVPYSELPATAFALAALEFACVARESDARLPREIAAALALGIAATMRIEAFAALPLPAVIALSGRPLKYAIPAGASLLILSTLPLSAHLGVMASIGVGPSRIHYVEEFIRNFSWDQYFTNLGNSARELVHAVSPKRNVLAAMSEPLVAGQAAARVIAAGFFIIGVIAACAAPARRAAIAMLALLIAYPVVHALWHYSDARFLVIVWPAVALFAGRGVEALAALRGAAARPALFVTCAAAPAAAIALLLAGERVASVHANEWDGVAKGPADALMLALERGVPSTAEGYFEFGGPTIAFERRAPVHFAFSIKDFFEADLPPETIPAQVARGNRFVVTAMGAQEWLARRVPDAAARKCYKTVFEEPGRTILLFAAPDSR